MPVSDPMETAESLDLEAAARACRLFYLERHTKQEIATELRISRFKVARLIAAAHARGLVRIEIDETDTLDGRLAARLQQAFDLRDAIVVRAHSAPAVGSAAARLLCDRLRPGDVLGIPWGTTIHQVVDALESVRRPRPVDVVQLAGGVRGVDFAFNGIGLAARAAALLGGRLYPLHAPAFVASPAARRALLAEPSVKDTFAMFDRVSVAVTGIGAWQPAARSALERSGALSMEDLRRLRRLGACGDALCHFFDASGHPLSRFESRTIAPSARQIRAIGLRIGVAVGGDKLLAIRGAIRGRLINALVTDGSTARALLRAGQG